MKSVNPCITPAEAQEIIRLTADPINDEHLYSGMLGAGRINAYNAVKEASTRYIQNTTITGTKTFSSEHSIKAGNHVTDRETHGDVIIENGANVIFKAGEEVILDKGFEIKKGATFEIKVEPGTERECGDGKK